MADSVGGARRRRRLLVAPLVLVAGLATALTAGAAYGGMMAGAGSRGAAGGSSAASPQTSGAGCGASAIAASPTGSATSGCASGGAAAVSGTGDASASGCSGPYNGVPVGVVAISAAGSATAQQCDYVGGAPALAISGAGSASACSSPFGYDVPTVAVGLTGANSCDGPAVTVLGPATSQYGQAVSAAGSASGQYAVSGAGTANGCVLAVSVAGSATSCPGGSSVDAHHVTLQGNRLWPPPDMAAGAAVVATMSYATPGIDPAADPTQCTSQSWAFSSAAAVAAAGDTADNSKVEVASLTMAGTSCERLDATELGRVNSLSLTAVLAPGPGTFTCTAPVAEDFAYQRFTGTDMEITMPVSCQVDGASYPATLRYVGSWTPVLTPGSNVTTAATAGALTVTPV